MLRPRILLVPDLTELEWRIKPLLDEWADVATFDAPGVGDESALERGGPTADEARPEAGSAGWEKCIVPGDEGIVERGLAEIDRRGWDRCIVVGDEFGAFKAAGLAAARPERVEALVLGHACLTLDRTGDRPATNAEVFAGFARLARADYRTFARTLTQVTQGGYDDELVDAYIARVPPSLSLNSTERLETLMDSVRLDDALRRLDVPLLLAEHRGCLLFTHEGYEDALAAFPDAERAGFDQKPSVSPEFAETLRAFAARVAEPAGERAQRPG